MVLLWVSFNVENFLRDCNKLNPAIRMSRLLKRSGFVDDRR